MVLTRPHRSDQRTPLELVKPFRSPGNAAFALTSAVNGSPRAVAKPVTGSTIVYFTAISEVSEREASSSACPVARRAGRRAHTAKTSPIDLASLAIHSNSSVPTPRSVCRSA